MFSSWCPKAVIAAGRLPDALVNRYVLIRMRRKASHEHCDRLRNLPRYTDSLGRKSVRFVLDHAKAISEAMPKRPADLNDQAADNWEPLLVLADLAGDPWPTLAREAAVGLTATAEK